MRPRTRSPTNANSESNPIQSKIRSESIMVPLSLLLLVGLASCRLGDDAIPVVEIRGEGAPMSSAQIRHLEELENGGPLDIKLDKTFVPAKCARKANRLDFVTFHYKVFTEDNKKVHQTYGGEPVTIQLGTGMIMPGLDKGLKSMCNDELRKIRVPYRLSRKSKSRVWKNIPNDENWLTFDVEMLKVVEYSHDEQFRQLDRDGDGKLTAAEMLDYQKWLKKDYGKSWKNADINPTEAAAYYVKYFDVNGDANVTKDEWLQVMARDEQQMQKAAGKLPKGRKRDPGVAWILDFNNDGVVTAQELDQAADAFEKEPKRLPSTGKDEL